VADPSGTWPSQEEIEARSRAAWAALPAEEKLEYLEHVVSGLLAARAAGPKRPGEADEPDKRRKP